MTGWNYRVVRKLHEMEDLAGEEEDFILEELAIHMVYYHENGRPRAVSEEPSKVNVFDENVEELKETLKLMLEACEKPVLNYDDF